VIGISCPNLSLLPFESALERVSKEFTLWEIIAELEHELLEIESQILYAQNSYGMTIQVHAPIADLNLGSPAERLRKAAVNELFLIMDCCERLSIELITIHPGAAVAYGNDIKPRVREATKRSIEEIDRKLDDMHLKIALENMPPDNWSIGYDADELLSMIEDTDVGICLDVGHANIAGTLDTFFRKDIPILNVHLHDNYGEFDQHLAIGEGIIDIPSAVFKIEQFFDGSYIVEARSLEEGVVSKKKLSDILSGLKS